MFPQKDLNYNVPKTYCLDAQIGHICVKHIRCLIRTHNNMSWVKVICSREARNRRSHATLDSHQKCHTLHNRWQHILARSVDTILDSDLPYFYESSSGLRSVISVLVQ